MHSHFADEAVGKIRPDGVALINSRLVKAALVDHVATVIPLDAVQVAAEAGSPAAVSLVMVAAFARITGLVGVESLVAAMTAVVPAYRSDRITENEAAIRAGFAAVTEMELVGGKT
jgi:Pyruvate/2-oxoacid:ferredoxin oxidoreductase gamma subunit